MGNGLYLVMTKKENLMKSIIAHSVQRVSNVKLQNEVRGTNGNLPIPSVNDRNQGLSHNVAGIWRSCINGEEKEWLTMMTVGRR